MALAIAVAGLALNLPLPAAAAEPCITNGATVTCTYTGTSEQTFTVPAGVSSVQVTVTGGTGGAAYFSNGGIGHGARVTTTLAVVPAAVLYLEVGSNGSSPASSGVNGAGGVGGGGAGGLGGGGGGGATAVLSVPCTTPSNCVASVDRANLLVVAGGGGGEAGGSVGGNAGNADGSGSAGVFDTIHYSGCAYGDLPCAGQGGGATVSAGGASGAGEPADPPNFSAGTPGGAGILGTGGDGGSEPHGGGGGGGGLFGGGGGGGAHYSAGAGGGGSSYSAGTSTSYSTDTTGIPGVVIQYALPTLMITADDQSMITGDSVPALTVSYSGFLNGDMATSLTTPPSCTTTATSASPVGTYPITCSGAVAANYAIAYTDGTLTVRAPEVLTPALTPATAQLTIGDTARLTIDVTSSYDRPVPDGTTVTITVSGANSQSTTVTTTNGQATFSYSATLPGSDTVTASIGEQRAEATVTWLVPASSRFATVYVLTPHRPYTLISAGSLFGHPRGLIYYRGSDFSLYSRVVTGVVTQRGAATVFGTAVVNGQPVVYRVDLTGGFTSGTLRIRLSNGMDTGVLPTRGGLIM